MFPLLSNKPNQIRPFERLQQADCSLHSSERFKISNAQENNDLPSG